MEDDYGGSSDCGEDHAEDHEEEQTAEEILGDPADDIVADRRELWRMAAAGARLADGRLLADIRPPTAELDPETAALQARLTQLRRDLAADVAAKAAGQLGNWASGHLGSLATRGLGSWGRELQRENPIIGFEGSASERGVGCVWG